MAFPRIASLKSHAEFLNRLGELDLDLPSDEDVQSGDDSPLAAPIRFGDGQIGNRFCILPMEGWDGTTDGKPTDLTRRRWQNFGRSGAKLIWGGEAVAVRHDGRANPNQLLINDASLSDIESLKDLLIAEHASQFFIDGRSAGGPAANALWSIRASERKVDRRTQNGAA